MAQKLDFFQQWLGGEWADRNAINRNAEDLENVEQDVTKLRDVTKRQAEEILQLRAMVGSLVEILAAKDVVDPVELEGKVKLALKELMPPPKAPKGAPYRETTDHQVPAEVEAAKKLMAIAQDHHFAKRFAEARATYQQVVDYYAATKQADVARQQLENLKHL